MTRKRFLMAAMLIVVYATLRLFYLTRIPIFTDEAIYIRWGQIALQDPVHRFISLEDGKQPLFIWLMLPALKWISDPLIAGRLISVIAGFGTLIGLFALCRKLFDEKIAWISSFIYLISPFFLLYDRLALYDSLTTAIMVWALFLSVLLVETMRLDVALLLGMTIGAGLLTKSSADFALFLLPTTLLLFDWRKSRRVMRLRILGGLGFIVVLLSKGIELILRLAPLSHMIGLKNHEFIITFSEFIEHPFERFTGNFGGLWHWTVSYVTIPLLALCMIGIIVSFKARKRKIALLLLWSTVPFLSLASFAKILYPRFLLFMFVPLLPIVALGISEILRWIPDHLWLSLFVSLSIFFYPAYFSYLVIVDPLNAPLPPVDRFQLLDDWPSGYGIPEVVSILREKGKSGPIFVGTEGTFGLTPAALEIYLKDEKHITIKGYWPVGEGIPELVAIAKTGKPTYLLLKDTQIPDPIWPVVEIARFRKGTGNVYSILLKVEPRE